jgi:hypothetical protein
MLGMTAALGQGKSCRMVRLEEDFWFPGFGADEILGTKKEA